LRSGVEKWEIPSLQNPWLITQLKYRGDGSYGNSIISILIINKYYSRDTIKTGYVMCVRHTLYKTDRSKTLH
jgi:hypothetical protein